MCHKAAVSLTLPLPASTYTCFYTKNKGMCGCNAADLHHEWSAEFEGKSSGHRYTHTEETQTPNQQGVTTIYRECNHITSKPTRSYNQIQGTQPYNLQKQDCSHIHVITHSSRGELRTLELETLYMRIRTNPRLSSTHIQPYDSPLQEYRDINKHVEIYVETKLRPSPSSHPLNQNY